MTQQVPTQGFNAPPIPGQAPGVPDPQALATPPAPGPNGNPITLPGQQPGYLRNPHEPQAPAGAPAQPQGNQPPAQNVQDLVALLTSALATQGQPGQPAAAAPQAPPAQRPGYMNTSANEFDVSRIDDPIIKSMATVMQSVGKDLDLDRALGRALAQNDPSLIDTAYIFEKGGANAAQLSAIAKGLVEQVAAKADAITKSVHAEVGGEANWHSSVAAFNAQAPQELKVTVAQMLDSTNETFIKAGAKLVAAFAKNSGVLPNIGAPLLNAASGGLSPGQGLDKLAFQAELNKLDKNGQGYEQARDILFARRSAGKRAGL